MIGLRLQLQEGEGMANCERTGEALPWCVRDRPSYEARISPSKTAGSLQLSFHRPCLLSEEGELYYRQAHLGLLSLQGTLLPSARTPCLCEQGGSPGVMKDAEGSQALLHFCRGAERRSTSLKQHYWARLLNSTHQAQPQGDANDLRKA